MLKPLYKLRECLQPDTPTLIRMFTNRYLDDLYSNYSDDIKFDQVKTDLVYYKDFDSRRYLAMSRVYYKDEPISFVVEGDREGDSKIGLVVCEPDASDNLIEIRHKAVVGEEAVLNPENFLVFDDSICEFLNDLRI